MSGAYSLQFLLRGGHDLQEYYNSPLEYLPNLSDDWYLSQMRRQNIILAVGSDDICLNSTRHLSEVLWQKGSPPFPGCLGGGLARLADLAAKWR